MRNKNYFNLKLLITPIIIVGLSLVYYYLDDYLDEGHAFTYLNVHGQGLATWWIDFEVFWGNFELWSIIGLWMGAFTAFTIGRLNGTSEMNSRDSVKVLIGFLAAIIGVASVFGILQILAPVEYDITDVLLFGWYTQYFPHHLLSLLLIFTGFWSVMFIRSPLSKKSTTFKINTRFQVILLIIAAIILHLTIISNWSVDILGSLVTLIKDFIGFFFVVLPLFFFINDALERRWDQAKDDTNHDLEVTNEMNRFIKRRGRNAVLYFLVSLLLVLILIAVLFLSDEFSTSIDVGSSFIAKNFLTWVYTAFLASFSFTIATWRRGS
ncbi:MAG: hypothetical protein ACFFCS_02310 [Candidatus Hodarchaeota archaeon]